MRASYAVGLCVSMALLAASCSDKAPPPPPMEFLIHSPYASVKTLAIAPAINLSGSRDFDPLVVSDTLFSELQQVQDINVIPLNKTILAMQRLGVRTIDDVKIAQRLAESLHVDALVIPAVTAYDPYKPPLVGMILQLYTPSAPIPSPEENAKVTPGAIQTNPGTPIIVADLVPAAPTKQPVSQISAVFNASNQTVLKELAVFARGRTEYDSALMDQRFLVDSDAYMRFVCHAMVRRLMDVERERVSDR